MYLAMARVAFIWTEFIVFQDLLVSKFQIFDVFYFSEVHFCCFFVFYVIVCENPSICRNRRNPLQCFLHCFLSFCC